MTLRSTLTKFAFIGLIVIFLSACKSSNPDSHPPSMGEGPVRGNGANTF